MTDDYPVSDIARLIDDRERLSYAAFEREITRDDRHVALDHNPDEMTRLVITTDYEFSAECELLIASMPGDVEEITVARYQCANFATALKILLQLCPALTY